MVISILRFYILVTIVLHCPILFRSQDKTLGEVQERLEEIREKAKNSLVGRNPGEEKNKTNVR